MAKTIERIAISTHILWGCIFFNSCEDITSDGKTEYQYMQPNYGLVQLKSAPDTLSFPLNEHTYNAIKTFNTFTERNIEYISFFDIRSSSLMIYVLETQALAKRLSVSRLIHKSKLYRPTVFVKNFDSIFVTNFSNLYLVDSSGQIKASFDFIENGEPIYATFEQTTPPIYKQDILIAGVRPYVKDNSLNALRKWKIVYKLNFQNNKQSLHYNLPEAYKNNLFGYHFLDYSYCYNDRGNFVFSFPADSTIYESNLTGYNTSYFAKSNQSTITIKALTKEEVDDKDTSFKRYMTQDSYGPVFFDPFYKRYLRVFKPKISEQSFDSKDRYRQNRFIIFNEHLKIIGESPAPDGVLYNSLFFTQGKMYIRTNSADEYALHFVRLDYQGQENDTSHITKTDENPNK